MTAVLRRQTKRCQEVPAPSACSNAAEYAVTLDGVITNLGVGTSTMLLCSEHLALRLREPCEPGCAGLRVEVLATAAPCPS